MSNSSPGWHCHRCHCLETLVVCLQSTMWTLPPDHRGTDYTPDIIVLREWGQSNTVCQCSISTADTKQKQVKFLLFFWPTRRMGLEYISKTYSNVGFLPETCPEKCRPKDHHEWTRCYNWYSWKSFLVDPIKFIFSLIHFLISILI